MAQRVGPVGVSVVRSSRAPSTSASQSVTKVCCDDYSQSRDRHVILGKCPECQYRIEQACRCGKKSRERPCAQLDWQCNEVIMLYCHYAYNIE